MPAAIVSKGILYINMFDWLSQAVMNFDDLEIYNEVKIDILDFSKLQSFYPVMVDQSLITFPNVDAVATISPIALVAILTIAEVCA